MAWYLEVSNGADAARHYDLGDGQLVIGRSESADIRLEHGTISRRHAQLTCLGDQITLKDLGSRHGTILNGRPVQESEIGRGDVLQIGQFHIRLMSTDVRELAPHDTSVTAWSKSEDVSDITTLLQGESPKIDLSHITAISAFGRRLLDVADHNERLVALCELVTGPELRGLWAMALEVQAEDGPPPLVRASNPPGIIDREDAYISRTTIKAMLDRGVAVLATDFSHNDFSIEMSVVENRHGKAAIACPLEEDASFCRALYLSVPPDYATTQWLAIISLAAKEYQQAEAVWKKRTYDAVERELDNARAIQQSILPGQVEIEGLDIAWSFKPCDAIGGDFVDVLKLDSGKVMIAIADVSGHGLSAALATLSIHSILQTWTRSGSAVDHMMGMLNEHLCNYLPPSRFVTMAVVIIDPETGETRGISAGHHPPVVVCAKGKSRSLKCGSNLVLGIDAFEMTSEQDHMEHGDTMLLYTDGLIELQQNGGEMLRTSGLTTLLAQHAANSRSASGVCSLLDESIEALQGNHPVADDQSFIVIRRS